MAEFERLEAHLLALQDRIIRGHGFHYAMSDDTRAMLPALRKISPIQINGRVRIRACLPGMPRRTPVRIGLSRRRTGKFQRLKPLHSAPRNGIAEAIP